MAASLFLSWSLIRSRGFKCLSKYSNCNRVCSVSHAVIDEVVDNDQHGPCWIDRQQVLQKSEVFFEHALPDEIYPLPGADV